jgi:hypothetical protein
MLVPSMMNVNVSFDAATMLNAPGVYDRQMVHTLVCLLARRLAGTTLAADERHRVPEDRRVLGCIEAHRAVERVVVLDVELQDQAGESSVRQVLLARESPGPRSLRRLERCRR